MKSLGELGDRQAADPWYGMAQTDADPMAQFWAAKALRQLGDKRGLAVLQMLAAANLPGICDFAR